MNWNSAAVYSVRPASCRGGERREALVVVGAERTAEAGVDLVLGQRALERFEHRAAEMEVVARELEVEERALPLLELGRAGST